MSSAPNLSTAKRTPDRHWRFAAHLTIVLLLGLSSLYSYLLFHTLVELFSIGVAFAILLLAWNTREVQDIGFLRIIATGFAAAAAIDLVHTLAYKGMSVFPSNDANLPTQLWIAARYIQALTLLAAPWLARRQTPLVGLEAAYGALTLILIGAIFAGYFPDCYIEGQGLTAFKINSEYLIVAIILAAVLLLHRMRVALQPTTYRLLQAMALVTVAQELAFTAYIGVYDLANMLGHILKLIAYYLLYRAIFVTAIRDPFLTIFRDLKASEQSLLASGQEIQHQNADLERRVAERTANLEAEIQERRRAEQRLRESEQRFRDLFAHLPVAYQSLDDAGRWLDANQVLADLLGYDRPLDLVGRRFPEVWDRSIQQDFSAIFEDLKTNENTQIELLLRRRDGRPVTVILAGRSERDDSTGAFVRSHCVLTDISERRTMEQVIREMNAQLERKVEARTRALRTANAALRESEEGFRTLFEETRQPLALMEGDRFVAANRATLQMLRAVSPEQVIGHGPGDFSPRVLADGCRAEERAAELIRLALEQGAQEFEWESVRVDGESFPARILLTAIRRGHLQQLHVVWNDITEQKQAQARVEYLAYYDALTGLPNRVLGLERLADQVARAKARHDHLAVLYLDLDQFKQYNDSYGHHLGDQLLTGVAQRLSAQLGPQDSLCRLAADEFMLVLPALGQASDQAELVKLCEHLLACCVEPFDLDGHQVTVSLSIGVAVYPRDGASGETLMRHADTALFEAKRAGRQTFRVFEPRMNDELMRFIETRHALREALGREELTLHYQPQIDLRTGRVLGVEALLRWHRPGMGLLMPGAFIDVAEESGLIVPISRWVLHEACRQAAAWRAADWPNLVMAVNLSAVHFRQRQVEEDVRAALDKSGLDPCGLELELTESILLHGEDSVLETVTRWQECGIHLSIDDFGTGYSSLAYLKRFQFDKLKIDRSFIAEMAERDQDRAIVQAIIDMARGLNLRTIAEGVDDAWLASQLRSMGCDEAQGYLYAKPLSVDEVEQWLQRHEQPRPV
ncbi:MAG: EAL domain-containing protein [Sphingobacteriia bacterium]|nr:EAL domain-containing protein [Sphingobacteriia bacterium]